MDLISVTINGITVPLKKSDLLTSNYFKNLLSENWKRKRNEDTLIIIDPDLDHGNDKVNDKISDKVNDIANDNAIKILFTLTSFSGNLPNLDDSNILEYYKYANYFCCNTLMNHCTDFFKNNLNKNNILIILHLNSLLEIDKSFYMYCVKYIRMQLWIRVVFENMESYQENIFSNKLSESVLCDILDNPEVWFYKESSKYIFFKLMVTKFKENNMSSEKITLIIDKWIENIRFNQLKESMFSSILADEIFTEEQLAKMYSLRLYDPKNIIGYCCVHKSELPNNKSYATSIKHFDKQKPKFKFWSSPIDANNISFYITSSDDENITVNASIKIINTYEIITINNYQIKYKPSWLDYPVYKNYPLLLKLNINDYILKLNINDYITDSNIHYLFLIIQLSKIDN